ncbi:hypothetical protein CTheo_4877 [Ceratobasidium theobromae]|uniref:Transmembrane protein n=1 Tax=Ceratobasidium theobromae TaxID=1582974 RepID=A0A5N5QJ56_9AGAM|nr:hypothetical protein CTheo_4877 [Ceratobasidium theobromae]
MYQVNIGSAIWFILCIITLGYPAKYLERLQLFEELEISTPPWSKAAKYSDMGSTSDPNSSRKTPRQKQQEEWDRLNITLSVITATSAAALSIQAIAQIHWLVTSFYTTAFGLSLQGLILVTYITVAAGGASDEAIGRLARGEVVSTLYDHDILKAVKPTAFVMALPSIFATYSSIFLLAGMTTMVFAQEADTITTHRAQYIKATMVPVGAGFLFLCFTLVFCEATVWIEILGRRKYTYVQDQHEECAQKETAHHGWKGERATSKTIYTKNVVPELREGWASEDIVWHSLDLSFAGCTCSLAEGANSRKVSVELDVPGDKTEPEGNARAPEVFDDAGV